LEGRTDRRREISLIQEKGIVHAFLPNEIDGQIRLQDGFLRS
jgi:hypothetical protein